MIRIIDFEDKIKEKLTKILLKINEIIELSLENPIFLTNNVPEYDFKKSVFDKTTVPIDKQRLVFGGKQLLDSQTIKEYSISMLI